MGQLLFDILNVICIITMPFIVMACAYATSYNIPTLSSILCGIWAELLLFTIQLNNYKSFANSITNIVLYMYYIPHEPYPIV